tara:strand:+ start:1325 stop:2023 length:699 start_codon:yes stop_codon:yes gene_type:complete
MKMKKKDIIRVADNYIKSLEKENKLLKESLALTKVAKDGYKKSNDIIFSIVKDDFDSLTGYQIMHLMVIMNPDNNFWKYATFWDLHVKGIIKLTTMKEEIIVSLLKGNTIAQTGKKLGKSISQIQAHLKDLRKQKNQYEKDNEEVIDYDINKMSEETRKNVVMWRLHDIDMGLTTPKTHKPVVKRFGKPFMDVYNKTNKTKVASVEDESDMNLDDLIFDKHLQDDDGSEDII